jgi:putative transposase
MNFLHDALASGRKFPPSNRGCVYARDADHRGGHLPAGVRVVRVLDRLRLERGLPERIVIDYGTAFTSKALDQWAHENKVTLHFFTSSP